MEKFFKLIKEAEILEIFDFVVNFSICTFLFNFLFLLLNKYIPFEKDIKDILNSLSQPLLIIVLVIVGILTFFKAFLNIEKYSGMKIKNKTKVQTMPTLILGCILMIMFMTILTKYFLSNYEFNSIVSYVSIVSVFFMLILLYVFRLIFDTITKEIESETERKNFFLSVIAVEVTIVALFK